MGSHTIDETCSTWIMIDGESKMVQGKIMSIYETTGENPEVLCKLGFSGKMQDMVIRDKDLLPGILTSDLGVI